MTAFVFLVLTWLIASVPTGVVLTTMFAGVDITATGSGNIGATNAFRVAGRELGAATLVGDLLKGLVPVLLAPLVLPAGWYAGLVALVAFASHCWSVYLAFRGGKGVATAAGSMLALAPLATLGALAVWVAVVALSRKSSLGALVATLALQVLVGFLAPAALWVSLLLGLGVIYRHKDNIRRLLEGRER